MSTMAQPNKNDDSKATTQNETQPSQLEASTDPPVRVRCVLRQRIRPSWDEWNANKAVIRELYLEDDKSLWEVMSIMEETRGFIASIERYKKVLEEWGFTKESPRVEKVRRMKREGNNETEVSHGGPEWSKERELEGDRFVPEPRIIPGQYSLFGKEIPPYHPPSIYAAADSRDSHTITLSSQTAITKGQTSYPTLVSAFEEKSNAAAISSSTGIIATNSPTLDRIMVESQPLKASRKVFEESTAAILEPADGQEEGTQYQQERISSSFIQDSSSTPSLAIDDTLDMDLSSVLVYLLAPIHNQEVLIDSIFNNLRRRWTLWVGDFLQTIFATQQLDLRGCSGGESSRANSSTSNSDGRTGKSSSQSSRRHNSQGKRQSSGNETPDDDPEGRGKRPRVSSSSSTSRDQGYFACPYYKRDAKIFCSPEYHPCEKTGFKDIGKLKEHLYRRHYFPLQCQRCKRPVDSQNELDRHAESIKPCLPRQRVLTDGFLFETFLILHNKKKARPGQSDGDRWEDIYSLLFPNSKIPTPYISGGAAVDPAYPPHNDSCSDGDAQSLMTQEVMNRTSAFITEKMQPVEEEVRSQLPRIFEESRQATERHYQNMHGDDAYAQIQLEPLFLNTNFDAIPMPCFGSAETFAQNMPLGSLPSQTQYKDEGNWMSPFDSNQNEGTTGNLTSISTSRLSCSCIGICACPLYIPPNSWSNSIRSTSSERVSTTPSTEHSFATAIQSFEQTMNNMLQSFEKKIEKRLEAANIPRQSEDTEDG